jgi:hypothetical protein
MKRQQYTWRLPPEIERRLGENTYGRPRAIHEAEHLLLILQDPPVPGSAPKHQIFLRRPDGKLLCNGDDFGETRLDTLLSLYQKAIHETEEAYSRANCAAELFGLLKRLGPLTRATASLHATLQAARTAVPADPLLIAARDKASDMAHDVELLLGDARLALDYRMAHEAETQAVQMRDMARAQHKLNILAAITFPLMALATLMSMNLPNGLEDQGPSIFWAIIVLAVVLGVMTVSWVGRAAHSSSAPRRNTREARPRRL